MTAKRHGTRRKYQTGCRCDQCKCAEAGYRKQLRQRQREEIGLFPQVQQNVALGLSLVAGEKPYHDGMVSKPSTSTNALPTVGNPTVDPANLVQAGVTEELDALGSNLRPGLAAVALAMARVLDNPRAISTHPAAAKALTSVLDKL